MEKCQTCQYYDRKKTSTANSPSSGQCRRSAPQLSPVNQKSYLIEGVWPLVRDDDWCGEWKACSVARRGEQRSTSDTKAPGPLLPVSGGAGFGPRPAPTSPMQATGSHGNVSSLSSLMSSGRGD